MTQIICRATSCLFWEQGICSSEEIEYEPDAGCLTFQDMGDLELEEDDENYDWEAEDDLFEEEEEEEEDWDEDEDPWDDDDF
jgi:hypothetical protein